MEGDLTHSPPGKQQISLACPAAMLQTTQKDGRTPGQRESLRSRAVQGWPAGEDRPAPKQPSCYGVEEQNIPAGSKSIQNL